MKRLLLGLAIISGALLISSNLVKAVDIAPRVESIESNLVGPNDTQTVIITYQIPSPPTSDTLDAIYLFGFKDGRYTHIRYKSKIPGATFVDTLKFSPPLPGHTSSYLLAISVRVKSKTPIRMRSFYWERTNNSIAMIPEPSLKATVYIRWSNPATAGVLGDSFRVWRRTYNFPNDTIGGSLEYQGTLRPGDRIFRPKDSLIIGKMYKYYGSLYLFKAERVRYPFFTVIVR